MFLKLALMKAGASTYWHIGNSGVEFRILGHPRNGPMLQIRSESFGNNKVKRTIYTTRHSLEALRDAIDEALAVEDFTAPYVHAAAILESREVPQTDEAVAG